jgi:hypothetical protein
MSSGEKSLSSELKDDNRGYDDELQKVPDISKSDNSTPDSELSGKLYFVILLRRKMM